MKIGIDGNEANVLNRVGIGEYAYNLLMELNRININNQFKIFLKRLPVADLPKGNNNWSYKIIGPKKFWTQLALPWQLFRGERLDLFFSPTHYAPRFCPCPRVISVMDLSFLHYPEMFKKRDRVKLKNWTGYSIKKARAIMTISNFTKDEIIRFYNVDPAKIFVAYPGYKKTIYHADYQPDQIKKVKEKYGLGEYLIFVGTIQPRKNIGRLLGAFNILRDKYPGLKLVLVGKKGWLFKDILDNLKKGVFKDTVLYLDYLPDSELALLYNGASCFVLPSLYEGFGIPVIEAMACGCPVAISSVSSLPEIGSSYATYFDPLSQSSIAEGISRIMDKDQSFVKEKAVRSGLEYVKKFSWENTAKQTLAVFEGLG